MRGSALSWKEVREAIPSTPLPTDTGGIASAVMLQRSSAQHSPGALLLPGRERAGSSCVRLWAALARGEQKQGPTQREQREGQQGQGRITGKTAAQLQHNAHTGVDDESQANPGVHASQQSFDHDVPLLLRVAARSIHPEAMSPRCVRAGQGNTHNGESTHSCSPLACLCGSGPERATLGERTGSHGK